MTFRVTTFENILGKGEKGKCWLAAFSPFPMFSTLPKIVSYGKSQLFCCLQMLLNLNISETLLYGNVLNSKQIMGA